jgi:hypothetical protein
VIQIQNNAVALSGGGVLGRHTGHWEDNVQHQTGSAHQGDNPRVVFFCPQKAAAQESNGPVDLGGILPIQRHCSQARKIRFACIGYTDSVVYSVMLHPSKHEEGNIILFFRALNL